MVLETSVAGVHIQPDRRKPQQIISWEQLPQIIKLLENIRRQRQADLEASMKIMQNEINLLAMTDAELAS